ncbi:MAG TPA: IS4 family transposase [Gemmatimonadaceae bacterium]|nr:IS4 family transposase [Gemmatimonadaceae bacterium]
MAQASTDEEDWAQAEFGAAELGDARRTARLVQLARQLAERPEASLPQALEDGATLKAAYRFFDNADIAHEKILAPHVVSSLGRMQGQEVILAVQDTTFIDYSTHLATEGLGPLHAKGGHGMILHGTLAFTPQRLPLGVLSLRLWARDVNKPKQRATRRSRAIEDKESYKWIDSVQAVAGLKARLPGTRLVSVGDRESDVFEFFTEAQALGVDVLVRAAWDRNVKGPEAQVFATLAVAPVVAHKQLALPASGKRKARTAKLEIRACPLTLKGPRNGSGQGLGSLALWSVWAYEPEPPAGVAPLDWKLLTSVPVTSAEQALERLEWYAARWGIEQWHKILKSGCRIEMRQLESAERLERLLTIYAVIAWRILYATLLARLVPEMACTAILQDDEWEALYCRIHRTPVPPARPPPLRQAIRWIARLGGFLGRTGDGEPGSKTLWQGFQELIPITEMYRIMKPHLQPGLSQPRKNVGND